MAEDWAIDVKKYAPDADDGVIAGIVRHCGIALRSRDASLVSYTDPKELDTVRESFLRRKLGLTDPDEVLDAAIAKVGERMKADHTKNRVTVYYLLAEIFGKLGLFGGAAPVAAPVAAAAPAAAPVMAAAPVAAAAAAIPLAAAAHAKPKGWRGHDDQPGFGFIATIAAGVLGLIIAGAIIASLITHRGLTEMAKPAPLPAVAPDAAPAAAPAPAIPTGAGVIAAEEAGKPKVSVYFDTAKYDVSPDFATVAAPIKTYLDAHPGARLALSGYNDPRGDAKFNAELSKNRAKAVLAALVALGVPDASIDLVKPADTTDTETDLAQARRVDISVTDAPAAN